MKVDIRTHPEDALAAADCVKEEGDVGLHRLRLPNGQRRLLDQLPHHLQRLHHPARKAIAALVSLENSQQG